MKKNFLNELPPEKKEKTKKNLVWILVFSIVMFFAGMTSAYIVSMGDNFWVKINLPSSFYISTGIILLSSITLFLAVRYRKNANVKMARILLILTTILGIGFGLFQLKGYKQLVDSGAYFNTLIVVTDGRYGEYFNIKMNGVELDLQGNQYEKKGVLLNETENAKLKEVALKFPLASDYDQKLDLPQYGEGLSFLYKDEPLALIDGRLVKVNGEALLPLEYERLTFLMRNIIDGRGDFFIKGELGEDFKLYYKGKELEYVDRTLKYQGKPLSINFQNKLLRGNSDSSTAYLYIITFLHLLHVACGIIMLLVYTKRSFSADFEENDVVYLKSGSIFWHFLGVLWVYLLLFLHFIH